MVRNKGWKRNLRCGECGKKLKECGGCVEKMRRESAILNLTTCGCTTLVVTLAIGMLTYGITTIMARIDH